MHFWRKAEGEAGLEEEGSLYAEHKITLKISEIS